MKKEVMVDISGVIKSIIIVFTLKMDGEGFVRLNHGGAPS